MKIATDYITDFLMVGQCVIPNDEIFMEVADVLDIFKRHKGHYVNDINVSRLGCGITRVYK